MRKVERKEFTKWKGKIAFCATLLMLGFTVHPSKVHASFQHELLPNGGFEVWIGEEARPAGWRIISSGNSTGERDTQFKLTGNSSIKFSVDNDNSNVKVTTYFLHSDQGVATLELWFYTSEDASISLTLRNFRTGERWDFDNQRWTSDWTTKLLYGSSSWSKFRADVVFTMPDEYQISIARGPESNGASIWIDNVSLSQEMEAFSFSTKIGANISIQSVSGVPLWSDPGQQEAFQDLHLNSVRIEVIDFGVILSYSEENGFEYNWTKLDTMMSTLISLNPDLEFIFMIGFPYWCRPPGLPMIEEISSDSTGGYYNYPVDEALALFCHDVAVRSLEKGWNVKTWMIHNEPNSNLQDQEEYFPLLVSNYNAATVAVKNVIPDASITMGFINTNPFFEAFLDGCSSNTNTISVHKSGGIDTPTEEVFFKADKWWWHYYSPEKRVDMLASKRSGSNIPIVVDEGSMIEPVDVNPLNHSLAEVAYEALMFKYALFRQAKNWHYTPFAFSDPPEGERPALIDIQTKERYPIYWFIWFLRRHLFPGDSIIYEGEISDKVATYFVWKHSDGQLYYLLVNRAPDPIDAPLDFIAPTNFAWVFNFTGDGVDSVLINFESFSGDTEILLEPYQAVAIRTPDFRTRVLESSTNSRSPDIQVGKELIVILGEGLKFPVQLSLFDIQGRLVRRSLFTTPVSKGKVSIKDLPNGIFFLLLNGEGVPVRQKWLILR